MTSSASRRRETTTEKPARRNVQKGPNPAEMANRKKVAKGAVRQGPPLARQRAMARALRAFRAQWRHAALHERVQIERQGVPADVVRSLVTEIGVSSTDFIVYVGMPKATFSKKIREKSKFAGAAGQSVVGFVELINKVEDILAAQGDNPDAANFDVERWVGEWVERPQPALGGVAPAELMDTPSGRASVMRVLGAMQSGAYQ